MKTILLVISLFSFNAIAQKEGRFQIVKISSGSVLGSLMIDTQTGKIWKHQCVINDKNDKCQGYAWGEEDVVGITTSVKKLSEKYEQVEKDSEK